MISLVANHGLNILISGETGVGKDIVAQRLYSRSSRVGSPFIKINCSALPAGLLESELFGYERGAFTGAERRTRGKFQLAHRGVLFLDEIGEMPVQLQSKLLHVLQSGEFTPLGSENPITTDAWIIAATNCDLQREIVNKRFREDLYYRLNIIKIEIPPLRERPEDIPVLIDHFIDEYSSRIKGRAIPKPNDQIIEKMVAYPWPGNVRQLQNVILKMMVLDNWDEVLSELSYEKDRDSVPIKAETPSASFSSGSDSSGSDVLSFLDINLQDLESLSLKKINKELQNKAEKEIIFYVLKKTGWNRKRAAKILRISYRALLYKINDLNLKASDAYSDDFDHLIHRQASI
jgi:transcriptional regulator with PAS, ATPase and Fis domain